MKTKLKSSLIELKHALGRSVKLTLMVHHSTPCAAQERLQSLVPELDALVLLLVNIVALPLSMSEHRKGRVEEQI